MKLCIFLYLTAYEVGSFQHEGVMEYAYLSISSADGTTKDICVSSILKATIWQCEQFCEDRQDNASWVQVMGCFRTYCGW